MDDLQKIKRRLARLRRLQQNNPFVFARVADCLLQLRKYKAAYKILTEGLSQFPEYVAGWLVTGNYHLMKQNPKLARRAFEKALRLDPVNPYALERISQFAEDDGDFRLYRKYRIALAYLDPMNGKYQRMLQLDLLRRIAIHEGILTPKRAELATLAELRLDLLEYDLLPEKLRRSHVREEEFEDEEEEYYDESEEDYNDEEVVESDEDYDSQDRQYINMINY